MKRLFMLLCAVVALAACEQAPIEETQGVVMSDRNLEVSFEGDDTRIQLQNGKTVWTKGDHVSVFYRSTVNEEWQFMGETGDRTGNIVPVDNSVNPPATHNHVVVAYPYSADYFYNTETHNVEASLPAVQSYLKDSYGTNGNLMISSSEFNKVSLKSVCGWLKLQLTGDGEVVKSITLRGNDGEQVAGLIYVDSAAATATLASASGEAGDGEVGGTLVRPGTILTEVTLNCGEGVKLGKNATAFYIALPPQTFDDGFTVEVACVDGSKMVKSSNKALSIERNHIQPMAEFSYTANISPSNQIWYTSSDGNVVKPNNTNVFGATIISNEYNNGMGVITFDGDVTMIGNQAFYNCASLTSVNIPDTVTSIGEWTFSSCSSLTSVNIPDSVTTIGEAAFTVCKSLTSVTIGDSVTEIGNYAFADCNSLTSVNIPDSVTTIGEGAFAYCNSLTSVTIPDSVTTIGYQAFAYCPSLTSVTIGDSVATIGESAFEGCDSLTSVNIPDSVMTIGRDAFAFCDSLTSVTIPDSVTTIGDYAFYSCNSLTSVYCKATTPPALSGTYIFDYNGSGRKIYVPAGSVNAYKSAEYWSEYADAIVGYDFETGEIVESEPEPMPANNEVWYTSSDGNVVTPYKTNVYGAKIVSNKYNNGMGVITFDGDVTSIGEHAFYDCTSLTSVTIPDSVTSIGNAAFYECTSLTSVNIPDSVTSIGGSAFYKCTSLTSVTIGDSVTEIGRWAFLGCTSLKEFKGKFATEDGRSLIVDNTIIAYANASGATYTIPDSVTTIGEYAFAYCDSLTSVTIPDSVTSIGYEAFRYCTSLTSVTIPDSVTEIESEAFEDCSSLTSVTIPDSVTSIGYGVFSGCSNLAKFKSRFAEDNGRILVVDGVLISFAPKGLTEYTILDNITKIGVYAFYDCDSLTSVTIPDSVTSIGSYAFYYCKSLTSVYCKATTPPALGGTYAFDSNGSGRKIYVPAESVEVYKAASGWSGYASYIVGYDFENGVVVE